MTPKETQIANETTGLLTMSLLFVENHVSTFAKVMIDRSCIMTFTCKNPVFRIQ